MPAAVAPDARGVRVAGEVLVVPPFECAWLTSSSGTEGGGGELIFEAVARSDITCILERNHRTPTRRLDHWSGRLAANDRHSQSETQNETYVIIIGSHRNSRLCIERNGCVAHTQRGAFIVPGADEKFARYWVTWTDDGLISVGIGGHGVRPKRVHRWKDPNPIRNLTCVGLSTWDDWTRFRNIELHPPPVSCDVDVDAPFVEAVSDAARTTPSGQMQINGNAGIRRVAPAEKIAAVTATREDESRTNLCDLADVFVFRRRVGVGNEKGVAEKSRVHVTAAFHDADLDATCVGPVKAHAAILAAACPKLRQKLEQARRVLEFRNATTTNGATADIAAALGMTRGGYEPSDNTSGSLQFVVTVSVDEDESSGPGLDGDEREIVQTLDRFASLDAAKNETKLKNLLSKNESLNEVVDDTFTDVVLVVRCADVSEAQACARTSGIPTTVIVSDNRSSVATCRSDDNDTTETEKELGAAVVEFHAHRLVLAARACFFRDLFGSGMRESIDRRVSFRLTGGSTVDASIDPAALAAFLRFTYHGSFPPNAPAAETLSLCLRFRANSATKEVVAALIAAAERDPVDAARLLGLAPEFGVERYDETDDDEENEDVDEPDETTDARRRVSRLFGKCVASLALDGFKSVELSHDAFAQIPAQALAAVMARDDLNVRNEDATVRVAAEWVRAGVRTLEDRERVAREIRWPFVSALVASQASGAFGIENVATIVSPDRDGQNLAVSTDGDSVCLSFPTPNGFEFSGVDNSSNELRRTFRTQKNRSHMKQSTPRLSFGACLVFVRCGDQNGVFRHIGSNGGARHFRNPAATFDCGIKVTASSPICGHTDPAAAVSDAFTSLNFAGPPRGLRLTFPSCFSGGWWVFDLGKNRGLRCDYYAVRHDGTNNFPRNWELQGRVDCEGEDAADAPSGGITDQFEESVRWISLSKHVNDNAIHEPGAWGSWSVPTDLSTPPVRWLRLVSTGANAGTEGQGRFHLCSVEFYGLLTGG